MPTHVFHAPVKVYEIFSGGSRLGTRAETTSIASTVVLASETVVLASEPSTRGVEARLTSCGVGWR